MRNLNTSTNRNRKPKTPGTPNSRHFKYFRHFRHFLLSPLLTLTLTLTLTPTTNAQEYYFKSYSIEQGLPQSNIFCCIEDQRGELWLGTEGSGICRFNGIDFQIFNKSDGLSGNIIRSVFEDSKGNIWIGTENGLDIYDGYQIRSCSPESIGETAVLVINEDKSGNIWVGTEAKGLFRINNKDSLVVENFTISNGLVSMFIFDIDFDNYDRLWLSMIGGINVVDLSSGDFKVTKLLEDINIPSSNILCGDKDSSGNIWFGTLQQGVFKIEVSENLENIHYSRPDYLNFLNSERIWDIHWSSDNECFLATNDQGIVRFNNEKIIDVFNKKNGLKTNQIYRITESPTSGLWFSALGSGILKFDNKLIVNYNAGSGINGSQVYDIKGYENNLLIGSDEGFSIFEFKDDIPVLKAFYNNKNGLPDKDITSIYQSGKVIWLGSSEGVAKIENGKVSIPDFNDELSSKKVNCLLQDTKGNLWIGTDNGYNLYKNNKIFYLNEDQGFVNNEVQTIIEHSSGDIWMGTLGGLVRLRDSEYTDFIEEDGLSELSIHSLAEDVNGDIWIATFGGGLFLFEQDYDSIPIRHIVGNEILSSKNIYSLKFFSDSLLIAGTENGFDEIILDKNQRITQAIHYDINDGFPGGRNNLNALYIDDLNQIWFGNSEGLARFTPSGLQDLSLPLKTQISTLKLFFEEQDWETRGEVLAWFNLPKNLVLPYHENHITFGFSSIFYGDHSDIKYSYFLDGQSKDWSPFQSAREIVFPGLRPGKYIFKVRAINKFEIVGNTAEYSFITIRPPVWMRPWFIILMVFLIIAIIILFIQLRIKKLQEEKIQLEKIVKERTKEVVEKKNEIEKQHDIVMKQNMEIESSIHYAERIQNAVFPSKEILKENFNDFFILFHPQHIVSGDFYWIGQNGDNIIFTAVDCTGHGVPGAFMSMLGISYLNQIVIKEDTVMPDQILNKLRAHVISSFSQKDGEESDTKDGMDIALCTFNLKTKKLYYSGAYNSLYLIRSGETGPELSEYTADKMPIGSYARMDDFKLNEINYKPGDTIYLFSDGFPDQYGGPKFKKFMKKPFREMLLKNYDKPLASQKKIYDDAISEWMSYKEPDGGDIIQTDDILVIGVKL